MTPARTRPRFHQFELVLALLCAVMLVYTIAKWRGWIRGEPLYQPLRLVLLMSYLTAMAGGWLALRHSQRLAWVLLVVAAVAFVLFVANMMAG